MASTMASTTISLNRELQVRKEMIMKIKILFLLLAFHYSIALAQDNDNERFITKLTVLDANEKVSQHLFNSVIPKFDGAEIMSLVEQANLQLKQAEENGFKHLQPTIAPMLALGNQASCSAINSEACPDSRAIIERINRLINRDAGTGVITLATNQGAQTIKLFESIVEPHCSDSPSLRCAMAVNVAENLWEISGLYRAIANTLNQEDKLTSTAKLTLLDRQWRSYKNDTIKLWPQEVLLSSLTFRPNERGFSPPPNYKILSLRPSLGLSYLSDASPDFSPTINVDLIGIYWWKYHGSKTSTGRGIAASLVWNGDDTAYGLTYHHNPKWSATLARSNENKVVFSVSFQLAYWLLK